MQTKILIIGAGPYGISLAYELWERKVPFIIVGKPFDLWFKHTLDTMSIRSDRHTSEIYTRSRIFNLTQFIHKHSPLHAEEIIKKRLPCKLFREYLEDVLEKLPFTIEQQKVTHVTKEGHDYVSTLENGQVIHSASVVLATGIAHHKKMPESLVSLQHEQIIHSWDVGEYADFKNKKVMVVGGGQSAAECVDHLMETNEVTWVMRRPPVFYSEPINLPKPIFQAVLYLSPYFYFLSKKMKKRLGNKFVETTVTPDMIPIWENKKVNVVYDDVEHLGIQSHGEQLFSPKLDQSFDAIVSSTGYQHDIECLHFLSEEIRKSIHADQGIPQVNYDFETSLKSLYIVGGMVEPDYGPAQRFMMGSRHATLKLGKVLQA